MFIFLRLLLHASIQIYTCTTYLYLQHQLPAVLRQLQQRAAAAEAAAAAAAAATAAEAAAAAAAAEKQKEEMRRCLFLEIDVDISLL